MHYLYPVSLQSCSVGQVEKKMKRPRCATHYYFSIIRPPMAKVEEIVLLLAISLIVPRAGWSEIVVESNSFIFL